MDSKCLKILRFVITFFLLAAIAQFSDSLRAGRSGDQIQPVPVAERSTARVYGRSIAGIAGWNPAGVMDVCVVCVVQ
jgi:hypothetical protein